MSKNTRLVITAIRADDSRILVDEVTGVTCEIDKNTEYLESENREIDGKLQVKVQGQIAKITGKGSCTLLVNDSAVFFEMFTLNEIHVAMVKLNSDLWIELTWST